MAGELDGAVVTGSMAPAREGRAIYPLNGPPGLPLVRSLCGLGKGTAAAFACDPMALALAQEAVAAGALAALSPVERSFLLLPYMHSESKRIHEIAERLYREHAPPENHDFELRHKAIIDRFGRYPHRNALLGRESTPEEREFLTQPGSSF